MTVPITYPSDWSQGWFLTALSSCMCLLGCLVIYLDDLYYFIMPKSITSRYGFNLNGNYSFLNASLAFSAGCLLFTSLFRLLPEALEYLKNSVTDEDPISETTERKLQFNLIVSYIVGTIVCVSFNTFLHYITSESVVHCNHGDHEQDLDNADDNEPYHQNDHQTGSGSSNYHSHGHTHGHTHSHIHSHSHGHEHTHTNDGSHNSKDLICKNPEDPNSPDSSDTYSTNELNNVSDQHVDHSPEDLDETTPLVSPPPLRQRKSLIHYFTIHGDGTDDVGECKGYSSAELCLFQQHNSVNMELTSSQLHFCEIPELRTSHHHQHLHQHQIDTRDGNSSMAESHHLQATQSNASHLDHKSDHHHHINTPLSRLLLIGIQTTLAITLHKLPEGFITYITSETNPQLGVSIFLSLLFHNFTEGFSMCLPLYYSFTNGSTKRNAKLKAIGISGLLGGLAQPLGALLGYLFINYNRDRLSDGKDGDIIDMESLDFVFGITLSVTSSFLTVIGLSMYGSAVSFGGSLNSVMSWCIFGISIIGLASIATS
ncbi:vacuolar Zn-iron permease [Scheffersomyces amazonensis]|uniref:vacuolar Zn-iron permease n=1 Tax=Scheffersomyces amazonensis TaxID=1078765 RepID=UPI00315D5B28